MFREIFTKRILGAIAFAIVFGMACYALGMWQLSRYEAKDARANAVEANYARAAVPLAQVLPSPASALGEDQIWSKVTVTGRYAVDRTLVVRTRSLASALGLEVLVPLRVGDATLLVDRGWVRLGDRPISSEFWELPRPQDASGRSLELLLEEREDGR